jgi:hypothetical protein
MNALPAPDRGALPRTAVILLNWNGLRYTRDAVASVRAQTYPRLLTVIADNGSANEEAAALRGEFPEARVVENQANLGFCAGNNRAAEVARTLGAEYLLFLNNDATLAPDAVETMVSAMGADPTIGAASPLIFFTDPPDAVWFGSGALHLAHPMIGYPTPEIRGVGPVTETQWACGCALMIRSALFAELGGFDERFFAYHEDVDLSLRLRRRGLRCGVVPAAKAWHVGSTSTGGGYSPHHLFLTTRNSCLLARRHGSPAQRLLFWLRFWPRMVLYVHALLSWDATPDRAAALLDGAFAGLRGKTGPVPRYDPTRTRWYPLLKGMRRPAAALAAILPGLHRRLRVRLARTYLAHLGPSAA